MSRLIDADVFEKFIKEKYKDGESTDDIKDQMLFDLSYQPTAYDVDKVVEQLENKQKEAVLKAPAYAGLHDKQFQKWMMKSFGFEEAIEIVKAGGVE